MQSKKHILIVGGGASGVITAIALTRVGIDPTAIDIAEPRELLGEGLAYQTRDPWHRLNVPTARMSAIDELPNDFSEWSSAEGYSFMERRTYSSYLRERLAPGITHVKAIATQCHVISDSEFDVTFSDSSKRTYSTIVLAMGHGKARIPDFLEGRAASDRIILDVWNGNELPPSKTLICFGTGLSFIDVAMTHLSRSAENKVFAISGSGNLPERHQQLPIKPLTPKLEEVSTLELLRKYLADAGENWREAIDGLRPITVDMWRGFSEAEREEFLRTDGSAWSRRRHRIAPDIAAKVDDEIASGRVRVIQGRVTSIAESDDSVEVSLTSGERIQGEVFALCIGRDYELSDPLTLSLLEEGVTNRGPLGMGLAVDVVSGKLMNTDRQVYPNIYAIGPLRTGEAFESTAIPEIRKQATQIAQSIISQQ